MALPARLIRFDKKKKKKPKKSALARRLDELNSQEAKASAAIMHRLVGGSGSDPVDNRQSRDFHPYEAAWIDVEEEDDQPASHEYVTYRERTQREQEQMRRAAPFMFSEFMRCSRRTHQWGDEESWNRDWKVACNCKELRERTIDVVDITSQIRISCFIERNTRLTYLIFLLHLICHSVYQAERRSMWSSARVSLTLFD
ncbi:hypothetical protein DFH28DRAFT_904321 [Melampsora americana]|nr:hypothetical protein DFH28DRAFT_904321 [Melampsora americana]